MGRLFKEVQSGELFVMIRSVELCFHFRLQGPDDFAGVLY